MTEILQEYCDSRGVAMRINHSEGVIRGVKILGPHSRNGRTYPRQTLREAARLYENAKVNVNHPAGNPAGPRDYRDRIGVIRNVAARGDEGLFADLHFNPRHALAEQLAWDAEHAPENVGFSHNVQARTTRRGDQVVVEAITHVQSVDLVADPATTRGLFESSAAGDAGGADAADPADTAMPRLTVAELKRRHPELVEALLGEQAAELDRLREQLQQLQTRQAAEQKRLLAQRLLREFHLPDPETSDPRARVIVDPCFLESLWAAEDEQAMRALVEQRAGLVRALGAATREKISATGGGRPLSRDQHLVGAAGCRDTRAFVEAIF
ncbi:MAG: hypothetical protein JXB62_20040 [Pirellulales bacterium]|nr:hypothetical protein [Pirellulales bacterium]